MTVLLTTNASPLPPFSQDVVGWHAAVAGEIEQHLTANHAKLLSRPEVSSAGTAWTVPESEWRRFADLSASDKEKLFSAVAGIRSDIRRLAESGIAPAVTAAWPVMWSIPDVSYLFAVAGRPVLAGWSLPAKAGRPGTTLDRLDDGRPWVSPRRPMLRLYGAMLSLLGLLALCSGVLLPFAGFDLAPPPAACTLSPGQWRLMTEQATEAARGDELNVLLSAVTDELGRREMICPLRTTQVLPPHEAALPEGRWGRRDISLLEGCWSLTTKAFVVGADGRSDSISSWKMCFNPDGQGNQTETTQTGKDCQGSVSAAFSGDLLVITQQPCVGRLVVAPVDLRCRRVGESTVDCDGRNLGSISARFER